MEFTFWNRKDKYGLCKLHAKNITCVYLFAHTVALDDPLLPVFFFVFVTFLVQFVQWSMPKSGWALNKNLEANRRFENRELRFLLFFHEEKFALHWMCGLVTKVASLERDIKIEKNGEGRSTKSQALLFWTVIKQETEKWRECVNISLSDTITNYGPSLRVSWIGKCSKLSCLTWNKNKGSGSNIAFWNTYRTTNLW